MGRKKLLRWEKKTPHAATGCVGRSVGSFLGNYLLPVSLSAEKGNKPKLHHRCPDDDKGQQQQTRVPPSNMCCQTGCSSSLFLAHALRCCSTHTFFVERSFSVQFLEEVFQECLNFWIKFWPGFAAPDGEIFFLESPALCPTLCRFPLSSSSSRVFCLTENCLLCSPDTQA